MLGVNSRLLVCDGAIELKLIGVESTDFVDESSNMLLLLRLSVHNSSSFGLRFEPGPTVLRSRISDHWVEAPSRWSRFHLASNETEEELFLIAPNADACRFRLRWAYERTPYPFGIGSSWARVSPTPMPRERKAREMLSAPACGLVASCKGRPSKTKGVLASKGKRAATREDI